MEIVFAGKRRFITADQQQMLTLLISTFEAAVNRNSELDQVQNELQLMNERLEDRIMARTTDLLAEIEERTRAQAELERFNRLVGDREKRMILLKQEVNVLSKELGRAAPYDLSFAESQK